jgi:hypothetical protein
MNGTMLHLVKIRKIVLVQRDLFNNVPEQVLSFIFPSLIPAHLSAVVLISTSAIIMSTVFFGGIAAKCCSLSVESNLWHVDSRGTAAACPALCMVDWTSTFSAFSVKALV